MLLLPLSIIIFAVGHCCKEVDFKNTPTVHLISNSFDASQERNERLNLLIAKMSDPKHLDELEKIANNFVRKMNGKGTGRGSTQMKKDGKSLPNTKKNSKQWSGELKKVEKQFKKISNPDKDSKSPFMLLKKSPRWEPRSSASELKLLKRAVRKELKQRKKELKQMKRQKQANRPRQRIKGSFSSKSAVPEKRMEERQIRKIVHDQAKKSFMKLALQLKKHLQRSKTR